MAARTKKKQPKTVIIPLTTLWVLLAVVLATTLVRLPLLNIPFERDEGEYAYIAWRMDYGEVPYKDWVDQKPPAIFWLYRLAFALPLAPIAAVHLTALLWSAASACALFYLARRFMEPLPAGKTIAIRLSEDSFRRKRLRAEATPSNLARLSSLLSSPSMTAVEKRRRFNPRTHSSARCRSNAARRL